MVKNLKNPLLVMVSIFSVIFLVFCRQESILTRNWSPFSFTKLRKVEKHQTCFQKIYAHAFTRFGEICDHNNQFYNKVPEEFSTDNSVYSEGKPLVFKSHDVMPVCTRSNSVETIKQNGLLTTKPLFEYDLEYLPLCRIDSNPSKNIGALHFDPIILNFAKEWSIKEFFIRFEKYVNDEDSIMDSNFKQHLAENRNYFKENFNDKSTYKNLFSNLYDNFHSIYCVGIAKQPFMLSKQNSESQMIDFSFQKILFKIQQSFENQIKVDADLIKNSAADIFSLKYSLNKILDNKIVINSTLITDRIFISSLLNSKQSPKFDQNKKYFGDYFAEEVFCLNVCGCQENFPSLYDEFFENKLSSSLGGKYPQVTVELTGEPLINMTCPQSPSDSLDYPVLEFPGNNEYLAYMDTADIMILENEPNTPIPVMTFDDKFVLSYVDELLESRFIDLFHSEESMVIYSSTHKEDMVIDLLNPRYVPEIGFGDTNDLDERVKSNDILVENFDFMFFYNESFLGTTQNNQTRKEFTWSVMGKTRQSIDLILQDQIV